MAPAAALILTVCFVQGSPAQAATIQVNTQQQGVTSGQCSLQEAIYASEFKSNMAIGSTAPDTPYTTGCTAGTGDDTIELLPPGAVFTFNKYWDGDAHNFFGPTATPIIFSKITIEGNGATLQWVDTGARPVNSRLFAIAKLDDQGLFSGTGSLTLSNVYVKGFHTKGGDGADGGGGGLGAGGAIFVGDGSLTIENSTFENNGAVGGNGGGTSIGEGGGGGGLSGNGGTTPCNVAGGGGGGSRGNGGKGGSGSGCSSNVGGGGGGGTVFSGGDSNGKIGGAHGFRCGGNGGDAGNDGHGAGCRGGGGGGGGGITGVTGCGLWKSCNGDGGKGQYGGGGGGGAGNGGDGDFGGGGGSAMNGTFLWAFGGNGGFGGGGGSMANFSYCYCNPGNGGAFGGNADNNNGGGGGALGGAIFNHNGRVSVHNSTFFNNFVTRGVAGGGTLNGAGAGGAIFSLNNLLEITYSTFSGNQSTGSGGAIVVDSDQDQPGPLSGGAAPVDFNLNNTIIANNGANECFFMGKVNPQGDGNLIMNNGSGAKHSPCPGVVTTSDPQLLPLHLNSPGNTPTMAILPTSPAANKAVCLPPMPPFDQFDQRGVSRPQLGGCDIGAFEARGDGT